MSGVRAEGLFSNEGGLIEIGQTDGALTELRLN